MLFIVRRPGDQSGNDEIYQLTEICRRKPVLWYHRYVQRQLYGAIGIVDLIAEQSLRILFAVGKIYLIGRGLPERMKGSAGKDGLAQILSAMDIKQNSGSNEGDAD